MNGKTMLIAASIVALAGVSAVPVASAERIDECMESHTPVVGEEEELEYGDCVQRCVTTNPNFLLQRVQDCDG